ncbi:MAG: hypothetical protein KJO23_02690 [Bacteroidia bacterium]|nr:hypothetical protein [Bacteroidia bacterium]NNM23921.1 hypothetical protein [Flavobacteriaceae bacterium]
MNAGKANAKLQAEIAVPVVENHLRVLSPNQRRQVSIITKDWQRFTFGVYSEMFAKI